MGVVRWGGARGWLGGEVFASEVRYKRVQCCSRVHAVKAGERCVPERSYIDIYSMGLGRHA